MLCTKVARYTERTYHPDRLLHPLRRIGKKGEGRFERITWEEAITTIAERLAAIAAEDPQQILPYSYAGTMGLGAGRVDVAAVLPPPRRESAGSYHLRLRRYRRAQDHLGLANRHGHGVGRPGEAHHFLGLQCDHLERAFLGARAAGEATRGAAHRHRSVSLAHGGKMPYAHRAAAGHRCRARARAHARTDSRRSDRSRLRQPPYAWISTNCANASNQYEPERVAAICGIDPAEIESLAHLYATTRPALIRANYGLQRVRGGGMAMRNITCLPALIGAFRDAAGGVILSTGGNFAVDERALSRPDLLGARTPRTINMSTIGRALAEAAPPIRALVVYNSNPVAVAPDSARVARGFAREDLFTVVLEHFLTDTADYADIVLPATTQLEHLDVIKPYGHYYMVANNPAIRPLGEAKPNTEIFRLLARSMGFTDACFQDSDATIAQSALAGDWDFNAVRAQGWKRIGAEKGTARFADGGFDTPSGKVEFFSKTAESQGLDPLPDYIAPLEDTRGDLAHRFPLAMISPPARNFLNSSFVNVASLRASEGEPWLDIHPEDAVSRGILDESYVRVFNDRGSLELRARVTDRARRGVVVALSVWWKKLARDGKNANELTNGTTLTDMGRAPIFYDCLVQVEPL